MARAGKLDQRITLQTFTEADDGIGGKTKAWANLASVPAVWAKVSHKGGLEVLSEGRTNATSKTIFTIRNRTDLDERMRVVWGSENYDVRNINRMGGRALYLDIEAERGV